MFSEKARKFEKKRLSVILDNSFEFCGLFRKPKIYYSGVQIRWQRLFWAENQGNHQNFDTSLLTYKC